MDNKMLWSRSIFCLILLINLNNPNIASTPNTPNKLIAPTIPTPLTTSIYITPATPTRANLEAGEAMA